MMDCDSLIKRGYCARLNKTSKCDLITRLARRDYNRTAREQGNGL